MLYDEAKFVSYWIRPDGVQPRSSEPCIRAKICFSLGEVTTGVVSANEPPMTKSNAEREEIWEFREKCQVFLYLCSVFWYGLYSS